MSESVELQVITDLAPIAGTRLETNAEQVKAWLTEQVAPYRAMVVSEEGMAADMKDDKTMEYSRSLLDREIQQYTGKFFVPEKERYQ